MYKGNYLETLTSFAAAFRAHRAPALVQIFEVGTAMMLSPPGVIKPVAQLMQEQKIALPLADFVPSVRDFYSKDGQLMAMPFNLSVPVLYYNRNALARYGYNKHNFPKTWAEMDVLAAKLKKAGYHCVLTTAYPGWILFESYLAIHGLPIAQEKPARAVFATPALAGHFRRLQRWQQQYLFRYGGRVDDATIFFTSGLCPLFAQSSGAYNSLSALVPFPLGVASLPLDTKASSQRYANVTGGAALWAVAGQDPRAYRGIALFFAFLARPEVQQRWHEHTGYLPIGFTGIYASILRASQHPILALARNDLAAPLPHSSTRQVGPQNQIRNANDEVLEAMFAGLMTPEQALQEAVIKANQMLLRFAHNNGEH